MRKRKLTEEEKKLVERLHAEGFDEEAEELALRMETEEDISSKPEVMREWREFVEKTLGFRKEGG